MSQPSEIHTLSGAYALDALTEIERAGFARHIAVCAACAQEVAEFGETASRLSVSASETPPARLREAVLGEVARTRQVTAGRAERVGQPDVARWRRWTAASVAAGVVALGGMGAVWVVQQQRVTEAEQQAAQVSAVLAAGDLSVRSTTVGGGKVTVAISPSHDAGVAVMSDMPTPPPGKVYQLWLITGQTPASAGVMAAGQSSGTALLGSLGTADTLGVTVEPEGGSKSPTTPTVATLPLT